MKNVGIRYIETRKVQFLDGTEKYPDFYLKAKISAMIYLQNGKCFRLEAVGSADNTYDTEIEASLHFGRKCYDLFDSEDCDILAKRLGCKPFAIWGLISFIQQKLIDMCLEMSYVDRHYYDELPDGVSIESEDWYEDGYKYIIKVGEKNISVNKYTDDQGDYGYTDVITFDLGDDVKIIIEYGNHDDIHTTGYENYQDIVRLEKLLGLAPGDGMKILRAI